MQNKAIKNNIPVVSKYNNLRIACERYPEVQSLTFKENKIFKLYQRKLHDKIVIDGFIEKSSSSSEEQKQLRLIRENK